MSLSNKYTKLNRRYYLILHRFALTVGRILLGRELVIE